MLSLTTAVFYLVPLRYVILVWGLIKFTAKLRRPDAVHHVGLMDFIARAPSNIQLVCRPSCTINWAAYRFGLPDFASSHWVHSLCLDYFVCASYLTCIISACMLYNVGYYCDMMRWAWWDWELSGWLTTLQCFGAVGWAIRPVKHRLWKIKCVKWDVKPAQLNSTVDDILCDGHLRRHFTQKTTY